MNVKTPSLNWSHILRTNLTGFILVFLFHLGFKLLYINNSGFWYGETFNLFYSEQDWGLIKHTSEWNRNPPLYYYFLYIWRNLFGISEFAIRFSSVLFSALAAGILYAIVNKHFNRMAAIISLVLFTSSNSMYAYSQEAGSLSLILFLTISSVYLFFELLDKKSWPIVILLGICNFLLVYGQYNAVAIPIIQLLIATIFFRKQIFKPVGISFLMTALLVFWRLTPKTVNRFLFADNNMQQIAPNLNDLKYFFYNFFNGELLFWIFFAIVAVSSWYLILFKRSDLKDIKYVGILFFGVGAMFASLALYFVMPEFAEEYFGFALPFLFVLAGVTVSSLGKDIKYAVVGATILFCLISFTRLHINIPKPMDYRNAIKVVKRLHKPNTLILVETRDVGHLFAYYFDKNIFADYKEMESKLNAKGVYLVSKADDVRSIDLHKYTRVILTQTFANVNPDNLKLVQYIDSSYKFRVHTNYSEVAVTLFGKK